VTWIDSERSHFYTAAVDRMDRGRLFRTMWTKNTLRLAIIAVLAVSGLSIAAAQTSAPADNGGASLPAADNKAEMNLSPAQMRAAANQYLPTMEQSAQTIRRQLEQARESRDVVKVLCLNDKLNQVDVALRSTKDRLQSLAGAADKNDTERSRHEFTVIQVLRDRVRALSQEASQCIGEETGFIDEPKVRVDIDPAIPKQDPTVVPQDPFIPPLTVPPPNTPVISSPTR
jgi:hypothetical protein